MKRTAFAIFAFFLLNLSISFPALVHAQTKTAGVAVSLPIAETNLKDGNIISASPDGYRLARVIYDSNLYGVYTESPAIFLQNSDPKLKPVITSGKAEVLVSSINGDIKENDFITTSTIPGVGQKADKNGVILGTALQDYSNSDKNASGRILVAVNPHFNASFNDAATNLWQALENASNPALLTQLSSLRYIIAAMIVLISFVIGFMYFGRIAAKGIEALGRNPLAGRMIQLNLILNLFIMIVVVSFGIGVAYLILIL